MLYGITYMWNLKNNTNESIYKTEQTHRHRKQTYGYQRGAGRRDKLGVGDYSYELLYIKIDQQQGFTV